MPSAQATEFEVRIFRRGRGTLAQVGIVNGVSRSILLIEGKGNYLSEPFPSLEAAIERCRSELKRNKADIFYVVADGHILETVLDSEYHKQVERRRQWYYAILSTLFFAWLAYSVVAPSYPFQSPIAYPVITALTVLVYAGILGLMGLRSVEGAIAMIIIMILSAMLLDGCAKHRHRARNPVPTPQRL